jgi:hypothetical protein
VGASLLTPYFAALRKGIFSPNLILYKEGSYSLLGEV